jgi:hypothetical protein
MVVHEDEHAIVKEILSRALDDDDCFAKVASDRSESERAEDRLVLAGFLRRLERQFDLREKARTASRVEANGDGKANGRNGRVPSGYCPSSP